MSALGAHRSLHHVTRVLRPRAAVFLAILMINTCAIISLNYVNTPAPHTMAGPKALHSLPTFRQRLADIQHDIHREVIQRYLYAGYHQKGADLGRDYPMMLDNPNVCKHPGPIKAIFLIHSNTYINFVSRAALRDTWLSITRNNTSNFRHVFLLGTTMDRNNSMVEEESATYGDILQQEYVDSHRNLTLKTVMGLRWVRQNCPRAEFVIKVDDDIFLNTEHWLGLLRLNPPQISDHMFGYCIINNYPERHPSSKYFVPASVWPERRYPPYCIGGSYGLSQNLVRHVVEESYRFPYLPVEDAFVGACLQRRGFGVYNPPDLYFGHLNSGLKERNTCKLKAMYYTLHLISPTVMRQLWESGCVILQEPGS